MRLRKCPACKETVGAESLTCPRCGVNFTAAAVRRGVVRSVGVLVLIWLIVHFVLKIV
jgi:hypothetical protein